jgi:hypothetical protein
MRVTQGSSQVVGFVFRIDPKLPSAVRPFVVTQM